MGATLAKLFIDPGKFNVTLVQTPPHKLYEQVLAMCAQSNSSACNIHDFNTTYNSSLYELSDGGRLSEGFYGVFQLLFLMAAYGYVLVNAATLIGDGAELLLLVPEYATLVGTLVLPILGAVPDGAIVLFSGMGADAQEQLSVGMGALAGSTIMLLTIPWFLAVYAGRVDIVNGQCAYKPKKGEKKLTEGTPMGSAGVAPDQAVPNSCIIMLFTSITYIIIQAPALFGHSADGSRNTTSLIKLIPQDGDHGDIKGEKTFALVGMLFAGVLFVAVCVYQVRAGSTEAVKAVLNGAIERKQKESLDAGLITFRGMFTETLLKAATANEQAVTIGEPMRRTQSAPSHPLRPGLATPLVGSADATADSDKKVRHFLKPYFHKYDDDNSDSMDVHEIRQLFNDLGESASPDYIHAIIDKYDADRSGDISFDEFCHIMIAFARGEVGTPQGTDGRIDATELGSIQAQPGGPEQGGGDQEEEGDEEESEEEDEEIPEDLADLSPEEQQSRIKKRALWQMGAGTVLCLLFSDPMVDVLGALGDVTHIPPFYISFVLAPLASNGTELLAAYSFALKKTKKSITVSLSQLEGAAIMNNTFCLAIFLFLIWSGGGSFGPPLEWAYSAEVLAILFVQCMVGAFARKKIITMLDGWLILALYPVSLILVMILEIGFKLN
jgi:Ca2+/Na+ antiporter